MHVRRRRDPVHVHHVVFPLDSVSFTVRAVTMVSVSVSLLAVLSLLIVVVYGWGMVLVSVVSFRVA
jgi:hypothetical protein